MEKKAKDLIRYFRSQGIDVHTSTKARGNHGFFLKNRIDISKNVPKERFIPVLIHEFAHYIHSKIEPEMDKTGGTIEKIFDDNETKFYEKELLDVTGFVDKNFKFEKLEQHKVLVKERIKDYEKIIKNKYPRFQRSKKFKEFDKYIKGSNAKYLLKYDRVKLVSWGFNHKIELYTIDNIEQDFFDMPKEFAAYIRLHSCQRKLSRISSKISRLKKYYTKPTEMFARFVEGLYIDKGKICEIAPNCFKRFYDLLECGYYGILSDVLNFISIKE